MHCVNSFIAHWVRRMNFTDDISGPRFEKSATARTIAVSFAGLGARYKHFPTERPGRQMRSEEHTTELQSPYDLVCRLLLEKKKALQFLLIFKCNTAVVQQA